MSDAGFIQKAVDLAPMLRYTADLGTQGKQFVPYLAMLASLKGELNRLFEALPPTFDPHTTNPAQKESS